MVIQVNRSSVSMGGDLENHEGTMEIPPSSTVSDLLREALKVCPLAYVGGKATWVVKIVDRDRRAKRSIGVLAEQWDEPKLVVSLDETAASLFADGAAGLYFDYRLQSDPESVFQELPAKYAGPAETINVDGRTLEVHQVELMREHRCRLLAAPDGTMVLEYQVSVGPYKIDIPAFHVLSADEISAHRSGRRHVGVLAEELSQHDQRTGRYERKE